MQTCSRGISLILRPTHSVMTNEVVLIKKDRKENITPGSYI